MEKKSDFLIVIPAYNEEDTIEEVVKRAKKYADVCVVNDCSKDSTLHILNRIDNIYVVNHTKNTNYAGAILDGMKKAVEKGYNFSITMDAGLSHNPDEIPLFIDQNYSDLAIGSRKKKISTPIYRRLLSLTGNFIYNISLDFPKSIFRKKYYSDIPSGFRRYSSKAMKLLLSSKMESKSFDLQVESVMYIYRNKLMISEVPITYSFSNSSLNMSTVKNCISMSLKIIFRR